MQAIFESFCEKMWNGQNGQRFTSSERVLMMPLVFYTFYICNTLFKMNCTPFAVFTPLNQWLVAFLPEKDYNNSEGRSSQWIK